MESALNVLDAAIKAFSVKPKQPKHFFSPHPITITKQGWDAFYQSIRVWQLDAPRCPVLVAEAVTTHALSSAARP